MNDALLRPAFSEPIPQTQHTFRLALKAMSEPGTIQNLKDAPALDAMAPATYALCLSLLDSDTPVWLSPTFDTPALRANLAFHCGCVVVRDRRLASFALLTKNECDALDEFNPGTDRDPDQSCTLLIQLDGLEQGPAIALQGPGIEHNRVLCLPVAATLWEERTKLCAFPIGLDIFFTSGQKLVALPRSTRTHYAVTEVI